MYVGMRNIAKNNRKTIYNLGKSKFRNIPADVTDFAPILRKTVFEVYKDILVQRKFAFLKVVTFVHGGNLGPFEKH